MSVVKELAVGHRGVSFIEQNLGKTFTRAGFDNPGLAKEHSNRGHSNRTATLVQKTLSDD